MPGFSNITGAESIVWADNVSFDGTERGGKITTDGQLLIGSTVAPHLRPGNLTSTGGTVNITNSAGGINLESSGITAVTTPGAYPYTTLATDYVVLVNTASARTIIPQATPTTGKMLVIKDNVGSAAANNITITPSGKNIDGAASSTINLNYGSVTIVYNGTEWSII